MNRREFIKELGRAGVLVSAGGALMPWLMRRSSAAETTRPRLIKLQGTPKDMGQQYGEQAADLITERLKLMRQSGSKIPMEAVEQSRIFLNVKANSILVEIEYLAEKLNEKEEEVLLLSAETPGAGIRKAGCSSFFIDGSISEDGNVWAGENIDDASSLERFGVVIVRHPLTSPPMITWALAGGVGGIGMNLPGLTLTMNYLQTGERVPQAAIFPEFVSNSALRQKDFKDASAVIAQTPLMGPCAWTLCDAEGTCVTLERTQHRLQAFTPGAKYVVHTNHFLDPELATEDTGANVFPNSKGRLRRLKQLLARKKLGFEDLRKILADTEGSPHGICREAEPRTIASVLMCPKDGCLFATPGRPDRTKYERFRLTQRPERE